MDAATTMTIFPRIETHQFTYHLITLKRSDLFVKSLTLEKVNSNKKTIPVYSNTIFDLFCPKLYNCNPTVNFRKQHRMDKPYRVSTGIYQRHYHR